MASLFINANKIIYNKDFRQIKHIRRIKFIKYMETKYIDYAMPVWCSSPVFGLVKQLSISTSIDISLHCNIHHCAEIMFTIQAYNQYSQLKMTRK